ncbi:MAG: hypothetical protein SCI25_13650 [Desulfuromonadales bacterium]|nr:hypothetical protein [Desulfuromonadales bacterium]
MDKIWITWECQRRNRELSAALQAKFFELAEIDRIKNPLRKYIRGIWQTYDILRQEKPRIVFCQNPSLILSLFLVLVKRPMGFRVCVDAHNAGLYPAEGRSSLLMLLARIVQRLGDLTLVTNDNLCAIVVANGGRGFVLPDRIPSINKTPARPLRGKHNILFICSYGADEPYQAVFEAARNLPTDICIYVTGNYRKKGLEPESLPENVILTGFVPEQEYLDLLNSVDATIDLTTRENCLVCGAYEAVAVGKPMILSKTEALQKYFSLGAVYSGNTPSELEEAILKVLSEKNVLEKGVRELKIMREKEWDSMKKALEDHLLQLSVQG